MKDVSVTFHRGETGHVRCIGTYRQEYLRNLWGMKDGSVTINRGETGHVRCIGRYRQEHLSNLWKCYLQPG